MISIIRSPINGYGAKGEACRIFRFHEFVPILTDTKQIYTEPFAFTASVFWNVTCKSAVLNDINGEIMNFWEVALSKEYRQELYEKIAPIWIGDAWYEKLTKIVQETGDRVYRAILFYMCNRASFSGIQTDKFKYTFIHKTFEKDFTLWQSIIDRKFSFSTWTKDFRDFYENHLLQQHGSDEGRVRYYVYADPPYVQQGKNYLHNMTKEDHCQLAKYHNEIKENPDFFILISYDDDPLIWKLYDGWNIQKVSWKTGAKQRTADEYCELMISNRPFKRYTKMQSLTDF